MVIVVVVVVDGDCGGGGGGDAILWRFNKILCCMVFGLINLGLSFMKATLKM